MALPLEYQEHAINHLKGVIFNLEGVCALLKSIFMYDKLLSI
jgi:hypothetical protein